jgi:hypothetical protein
MPPRLVPTIVLFDSPLRLEEKTVQRILSSETKLVEDTTDEELLLEAWRAEQLRGLGLPHLLAETFAALVDWQAITALVARGCSPELVLDRLRTDAIDLYRIRWPVATGEIEEGWTTTAEPSPHLRTPRAMETVAA